MKPKLEQKLKEEFPTLFERLPMNKNLGYTLNFEHDDGWYDFVHKIATIIDEIDVDNKVRAVQVKEKMAGIRFYWNDDEPEVQDLKPSLSPD